ncbi:hypothetical protein CR513_44458, partial [Mucuna pruriens]
MATLSTLIIKIFILSYDSIVIGFGVLHHGLYMLDVSSISNTIENLVVNYIVGYKHGRVVENSSILWHKYQEHILKERMERLIKEGILHVFGFSFILICVDCIKRKLTTRARKSGVTRREKVLPLTHTNICRPIILVTMGGFRYFFTFIDDFSRYGWVELLYEKSESLDAFKTFKVATELKLDLIRKVSFMKGAMKLDCGIETQYTMFGTSQSNEVVKRWNRTLMDMVRCMLSHFTFLEFLLGNALKTTRYIFNHVPSKFVIKTPCELMLGKRLSLKHFCVSGCKAEVRLYNPQMKKLDCKIVNGFIIGCCIGSRGSRFYRPSHTAKVIKFDRAVYFENELEYGESFKATQHTISHNGNSDPNSFQEAISRSKIVGCKWVFKTKRDAKGKIKRYKPRLVVKGYN